ncbi:hydroxyacylglutathione hydrolase-like protein isoform X1 [Manacus candei]|uniref:hydroxyacylglutathione hydrolase-like protein isoform X1 n=1 Tax=Manacus candei TaxID=415023 RepID=UPI002226821D|nr:hydroxyacylglutathione hydrolase-like protein isoform X1 [Manacus candei]
MKVKVISVLEDNYMYLVIEESTRDAVAVDAAVPKRLLEIIRKEDVVLRAILTTHHHWDHARGNEELARLCPGLRVFGADQRIGALTDTVTHGQELTFGAIRVRCLFTPCHTSGHMCYFMWEDDSPDAPALFSGDTLFVGGCGQFFEGTAEQMYTNLTQILGALPKDTKVFCGHECTVRNLKFALKVEPENEMVKEKLAWAKGGARAEVHGPDGPCGGAEEAPHREGQLQEAQGEAQPPGHAGLRLGALQPLPGEAVTSPPCRGSLLAVPSLDSLPVGNWCLSLTCSSEAAPLCSALPPAPCPAPGAVPGEQEHVGALGEPRLW